MNGLTTTCSLSISNILSLGTKSFDSQYDYYISDLHVGGNTKYTSDYCKTFFYYLVNNLASFTDENVGGNDIVRGLELRLYDINNDTTPVITAVTEAYANKFEMIETTNTLNFVCKMNKEEVKGTATSETFDSGLSDPVSLTLTNYPIKGTVTIKYCINGNTDETNPDGTLYDSNSDVNETNSTATFDVSGDSNVDSCTIDYVNRTINIDFNDTAVTSVDKIVVEYSMPDANYNYYIYKAELYVLLKKNPSATYTFDPAEDANGTIERKILTFNNFKNYTMAQTDPNKTDEPNKGLRLTYDYNESNGGYIATRLIVNVDYSFVWSKSLWA